jgi:hypothetical protein
VEAEDVLSTHGESGNCDLGGDVDHIKPTFRVKFEKRIAMSD